MVGIVVASYFVPKSLTAKMREISQAFVEYKQLKILKGPIKFSYMMGPSHGDPSHPFLDHLVWDAASEGYYTLSLSKSWRRPPIELPMGISTIGFRCRLQMRLEYSSNPSIR